MHSMSILRLLEGLGASAARVVMTLAVRALIKSTSLGVYSLVVQQIKELSARTVDKVVR